MQAITHTGFGNPADSLSITEIPAPEITPDQVLIRVEAVGLARGDWLITAGLPYVARPMYGLRTPKQPVAGQVLAGRIEDVGAEVTRFAKGDEVFGWGEGTLAELAAIPAGQVAPKPKSVSMAQAASIPVSGFAALQAVRDQGEVTAGMRVLVIGASGGVGSLATQIALSQGAEVTGVAGPSNLQMVRDLGADVIDYTIGEITDQGRVFDVIVDMAGNRPLRTLRKALTPRGTLVIVGSTGGKATMGFGRTVRAMMLSPFVKQRLRSLISKPNRTDLEALADLMESGTLTPRIGATYPLADIAAAVTAAGAGRGGGATVVSI